MLCLISILSLRYRNVGNHQEEKKLPAPAEEIPRQGLMLCHQIHHYQWGKKPKYLSTQLF